MKANDIFEGSATTKNAVDKWSGFTVDIHSSGDSSTLAIRNFMNQNLEFPTPWKRNAFKEFKKMLDNLDVDNEVKDAIDREMFRIPYDTITDQDEYIERQMVEILDIAEQLLTSMMMQYNEKQRGLIETLMAQLLENPENYEQIFAGIRRLDR